MLYFTFPYMLKAEVSVRVLHLSFLVSHSHPASYCQSRFRSCSLPMLLTSMRHNVQVTSPYGLTQDSPNLVRQGKVMFRRSSGQYGCRLWFMSN